MSIIRSISAHEVREVCESPPSNPKPEETPANRIKTFLQNESSKESGSKSSVALQKTRIKAFEADSNIHIRDESRSLSQSMLNIPIKKHVRKVQENSFFVDPSTSEKLAKATMKNKSSVGTGGSPKLERMRDNSYPTIDEQGSKEESQGIPSEAHAHRYSDKFYKTHVSNQSRATSAKPVSKRFMAKMFHGV